MEGAVLNGDGDLETDMPVELDAVIVVVIDVAIGALGDGAQRRPGQSLGAVEELIEDGPREVVAEIARRARRDAGRRRCRPRAAR